MDLKGYNQVIPQTGASAGKYAECLLVTSKSKRFSLGKLLYEKYNLNNYTHAGLYIRKNKQHYDIVIGFKDDELYKLSTTPGVRGISSAAAFKLYPGMDGIYEPVETDTVDGEYYIKFKYKQNI